MKRRFRLLTDIPVIPVCETESKVAVMEPPAAPVAVMEPPEADEPDEVAEIADVAAEFDAEEVEVEVVPQTSEEREEAQKKVKQALASPCTIRLHTGEEFCTRQDEHELVVRSRANMLSLEENRPQQGPQVYVCLQETVGEDGRIDCRPFCMLRALDMFDAITMFHRTYNRLNWIALGDDPQEAQVGFRKNVDHRRDSVLFSLYRLPKDAVVE